MNVEENIGGNMEEGNMNIFIPMTKVDAERREVWGWGAIEEQDAANEIMDYSTSKKHFMDWSGNAEKRSGGKSKGNVRSMHQTQSAGKLIDFRPDDTLKGFYVGAKIVDDGEWKKVQEGVYTGFSIGGSYLRRWPDEKVTGAIRYTAKPAELSLVDAPCIPGATFQMVKMASVDIVEFKAGEALQKILIDVDDLEKYVTSPEPLIPEPLKSEVGASFELVHMPEPNSVMEIKPDSMPSSEQLMQITVAVKDLCNASKEILDSMPSMVQKAIRLELDRILEEPVVAQPVDKYRGKTIMVKRSKI